MTAEPMPSLDDLGLRQSVDKRNMLQLITELPEQYETAMGIGRSFPSVPLTEQPNVVVMSGTGDSGLAVEMAVRLLAESAVVPVVTNHGGRMPKCAGKGSLVFLTDYSGNTEAILRNYREARMQGARVICVTAGGDLLETATTDGVSVVKIPPGQPQRTAIGYLVASPLMVFEKLGLAPGISQQLASAVLLLKNTREVLRYESPVARNVAKQTAESLFGKSVAIYGGAGYRREVAMRWKNQINANGKTPAVANVFPDVVEAEICAWQEEGAAIDGFRALYLKDPADRGQIVDMMTFVKELLGESRVTEVEIKGSTTAEKLLYGSYLGDFVSYYLALLYRVNPTATSSISYVQSRLAGKTPEEAREG